MSYNLLSSAVVHIAHRTPSRVTVALPRMTFIHLKPKCIASRQLDGCKIAAPAL